MSSHEPRMSIFPILNDEQRVATGWGLRPNSQSEKSSLEAKEKCLLSIEVPKKSGADEKFKAVLLLLLLQDGLRANRYDWSYFNPYGLK